MMTMLRIIAWVVWVQLIVGVVFITVFELPYRLNISEGQMYIHSVKSYGKTNKHESTYVTGVVVGWDKPVHLSVVSLMKRTDKFGNKQAFIEKYVDTGVPLDVFVGRMWMTSYDIASVNFKDGSQPKYSIREWVVFDSVLILISVCLYLFLTKRKNVEIYLKDE